MRRVGVRRGASRRAPGRARSARVFLALPVPEQAGAGILFAISGWKGKMPKLRWEPPVKWHLTLRFVAAMERERLAELGEAAARAAARCAPLEIVADALQSLPYRRDARAGALVLRVVDNPALDAFKRALDEALDEVGMPDPQERRWLPHITVARTRGRRSAALPEEPERCHCHFRAARLALVESVLRPQGAWHEVIAHWSLGAPPPAPPVPPA